MESLKSNHSIGMRFKMRFEGEEAPEQRYNTITLYSCTQTIDKKDLEIHPIYLEEKKNCFFFICCAYLLVKVHRHHSGHRRS